MFLKVSQNSQESESLNFQNLVLKSERVTSWLKRESNRGVFLRVFQSLYKSYQNVYFEELFANVYLLICVMKISHQLQRNKKTVEVFVGFGVAVSANICLCSKKFPWSLTFPRDLHWPIKLMYIEIEIVRSLRCAVKLILWADKGCIDNQKSFSIDPGVMW